MTSRKRHACKQASMDCGSYKICGFQHASYSSSSESYLEKQNGRRTETQANVGLSPRI